MFLNKKECKVTVSAMGGSDTELLLVSALAGSPAFGAEGQKRELPLEGRSDISLSGLHINPRDEG